MSCPICGKAGAVRYRPFCSRRCADIDLGKWFAEGYRVPSSDPEEMAEAAEAAEAAENEAQKPR
ncbi:MAG TPA: DNA gyrase inhibitor YacG [Roseovarius sp.]|nr:DNA gyrase inhibitor YacG [Roseovarius sp.]